MTKASKLYLGLSGASSWPARGRGWHEHLAGGRPSPGRRGDRARRWRWPFRRMCQAPARRRCARRCGSRPGDPTAAATACSTRPRYRPSRRSLTTELGTARARPRSSAVDRPDAREPRLPRGFGDLCTQRRRTRVPQLFCDPSPAVPPPRPQSSSTTWSTPVENQGLRPQRSSNPGEGGRRRPSGPARAGSGTVAAACGPTGNPGLPGHQDASLRPAPSGGATLVRAMRPAVGIVAAAPLAWASGRGRGGHG